MMTSPPQNSSRDWTNLSFSKPYVRFTNTKKHDSSNPRKINWYRILGLIHWKQFQNGIWLSKDQSQNNWHKDVGMFRFYTLKHTRPRLQTFQKMKNVSKRKRSKGAKRFQRCKQSKRWIRFQRWKRFKGWSLTSWHGCLQHVESGGSRLCASKNNGWII